MRILLRTSRWAIWARRLGSFALPLTVIPILMHRAQAMSTEAFDAVEIVALVVTLLTLAVTLGAISRLWVTGDLGWGKAIAGLVLGLVCLAPLGLWTAEFVLYPGLPDASTAAASPPELLTPVASAASPSPADPVPAFPNLKNRNYPVSTGRMFQLVDQLVVDRGWAVSRRREPATSGEDGQINAIAMTLLGFRDEVAVRVTAAPDGSIVAMRSASLTPVDEPRVNGKRVEDFLTVLDARVTLLMKDEPVGAGGDEEVDNPAAAQPVVPAPAPRGKRR